jgi:hypothetical protein
MVQTDENVTLKEHLEKLYDVKLEALALALRLQAQEYERRLELLNQAHERADKLATKVLTIEQYTTKHEMLITRIASLETADIERRTRDISTRETLTAVKTIVIALTISTTLGIIALLWEILTHGIAFVKP